MSTTIHGDLEAAFTAARTTVLAAIGDNDSDYPAWCRQVAAGRRALAEVYDTARDSLPPGRLLWHAVKEAADAQRDRAKHMDDIANRREQEGTAR